MQENTIKKRLLDLASRAYQKNTYTFSGFLPPADQSLLYELERELAHIPWTLFGGGEMCERQMVRFGSEDVMGYDEPFPIVCLVIAPVAKKFADALTHRDFLGALMHLGIERDVLGDIIVKENTGYVFCEEAMAAFLQDHLTTIKHTTVSCTITRECPAAAAPELKEEVLNVSAPRCDAIVAKAFGLSRSQVLPLFQTKRVFVNGRIYENNSGTLKPGDVVSARGFGKFIFDGTLSETKKGRIRVAIRRYV